MALAAATNNEMFEAALAVIGADYYYNIPFWIRLSYLILNTPPARFAESSAAKLDPATSSCPFYSTRH
jgi:hypothetical protein